MSGVTKHISMHEKADIVHMWNNQIKTLLPILPKDYDEKTLETLLIRFYPHEWKSVEFKCRYYLKKDQYLIKRYGKARHKFGNPKSILLKVPALKTALAESTKRNHRNNYDEESREKAEKSLIEKRQYIIDKITTKINLALKKTQQMTPDFLDAMIGLYERKNTTQKDRVYILQELKKYYSDRIIDFFFKLNDTELNYQLRMDAFYHLQSFNYSPRLRRQKYMQMHTNNKKRKRFLKEEYPKLKYTIPHNPDELEYRISNSKEQALKRYDYFISHSFKDAGVVQRIIEELNKQNKNVYCDWICDADYLKRNLLCEATLRNIENWLEKSDALIFIQTKSSLQSIWCKYELNFFDGLNRKIYVIDLTEKVVAGRIGTTMKPLSDKWFHDENYKALIQITKQAT